MPNRHLEKNLKPLTVHGNALNTLFSTILLALLTVLPFSLFYTYFSSEYSQSFLFSISLGIQAIVSACMGFSYVVSLVLAKQNFDDFKKESQQPIIDTLQSLLDFYRSILPISIVGKEKICYGISALSYISSAFVLSFEISIMATCFFLIGLSQIQLLLTALIIEKFHKSKKITQA